MDSSRLARRRPRPRAILALLALLALPASERAAANTAPPAAVVLTGESGGEPDSFGWSAVSSGDVNGDGQLDLLVGAPTNDAIADFAGRAYLFYGPFSGDLSAAAADARITAEAFGDNLGVSLACAGDVNGDGFDDVLIGARGNDAAGIQAGRAYLFYGPLHGNRTAASADAIISGAAFEEFGWAVAIPGDVNGDGRDDLLVGAPMSSVDGPLSVGRAYIFHGPLAGSYAAASAQGIVRGEFVDSQLGRAVSAAGDVDGDGLADLLLGSPIGGIGGAAPGRAYVFRSPVLGLRHAASADAVLLGEFPNDLFGGAVAGGGDLDGDGDLDALVGADNITGSTEGRAHVFYGPFTGARGGGPRHADVSMRGEAIDDVFGAAVAVIGDLDLDGAAEFIVGAWDNQAGGVRAGRAYVFDNPTGLEVPAGTAALIITGDESGDCFGRSVAGAGDLDGDGAPDFIVGAPQFFDPDPGRAYVYSLGVPTAAPAAAARGLSLQAQPNPSRHEATIHYAMAGPGRATLAIFDTQGRRVRQLLDREVGGGVQRLTWNGRDDAGRLVASGCYLLRLETDAGRLTRRLVRLR